jgi:hypothetical protein
MSKLGIEDDYSKQRLVDFQVINPDTRCRDIRKFSRAGPGKQHVHRISCGFIFENRLKGTRYD